MKVDVKRSHIMMKRKHDAVYENIVYKSFKPAYLFSKALGVMPLSYKRKNLLTIGRNTSSLEFEWSWKVAVYSCIWITLHISLKYYNITIRRRPFPPKDKGNINDGDLTRVNFSDQNNSLHLPNFPNGKDLWIGSVDNILEFICTVLVIIIGVFGARKIPDIFRKLQHLDENADEDGYMLLGKSYCLIINVPSPPRFTNFAFFFLRITPQVSLIVRLELYGG
jgi:hypothetical protein